MGCTITLHVHGVDRGRKVQTAHWVQLIAQSQTSHGEWCLHIVIRSQYLRVAVVLQLFHLSGGVTRFVVTGHHVCAE